MTEAFWRVIEVSFASALALFGFLFSRILNRVDADVQELKERVGSMEANVGPRAEALVRVEQQLVDHVRREETITWKQIEDNARQNQEAHSALMEGIQGVSERVVAVETILEARLPKQRSPRKYKK